MRVQRTGQIILATLLLASLLIGLAFLSPTGIARAECNVNHTVQAGQNLFRISLRYGVSMSAIAAANHIANVNLIFVGQVLYIPCSGYVSPYATGTAGTVGYIILTYTPSPTSAFTSTPTYTYGTATPFTNLTGTPGALDCPGFQATSPDAFSGSSDKFFWDPPQNSAPIARYQVHILNAQGQHVRSYEALAPDTSVIGDTGLAAIGEGINFYWYVVGVTADKRICQTPTRFAQRQWIEGQQGL